MTQEYNRTSSDSLLMQQDWPDQEPPCFTGSDFFSRKNIKNVLIYAPVGICILYHTGIYWANPACYAMTGHEYLSLEGKSAQTLFPTKKEFKRVYKIFITDIDRTGSAIVDSRLSRLDGTAFDCRLRACWLDPGDHSQGLLVTVSDITEIKSGQIRKNQTRKMEAIGVLAGGISHDFNNLLMAIQGHLSLIGVNADRPEKIREHIRQMNRLIEAAAQITGNLLGFAGGGKYQVEPLDINQVVDIALTVLQPGKENIAIEKKPAPNLYKVSGDRSQLEQVLLNLLVNASQAMVDGGTLTIETRNLTIKDTNFFHFDVAPGTYVEISIQDTGIGMDEAIQRKIFDPFFSTKSPKDMKGRGLGLSTVFGIVKNHGGFITVESKKDVGSLFRVALPGLAPGDAQRIEEESDAFDLMPKGGETVLIVDDENEVLEVGVSLLEALGYQALQARNGTECLDLVTKHPDKIALVILDLIMPIMDGKETFDRIRKLNPDIKILISSGVSMDEEIKMMLRDGCHDFLQKPFSMDKFSKVIRRILDRSA
ncbi:hybrid sensor histidine kinase/response regulator [Desulfobacter hydrogenophilus]|uniref:histidine kinase n=1 Tax=Desulfobacter hydrogenophilus TaxID=2291 RepID=A0A328FHW2_9BACT|nr:PAS domain-containing hybrid sensor histidine kinase/response regulator [Desulfobacter hydrogenophilus]NDY71367.1 response regulator [Desulfobacter hydrogenophilus]QBH12235.1 PAS domain-containing hybrid sensor histidine kinase/response regulator [Desulfobacter hydrogenophilus]RAM03440.1 hybrid sensor histidine kinase/response regulator [Desulfobacter hydrogenophilus]